MDYRCLNCGSHRGEPTDKTNENWYWRVVERGRIGPFCSQGCSKEFQMNPEPTFSLSEWEQLYFLRWRVLNGELTDSEQVAS